MKKAIPAFLVLLICLLAACGGEEPVVPHDHSLREVPAQAAAPLAEGNRRYWMCTGCDKIFSDFAGNRETTWDAVRLPALGAEEFEYHAYSGENFTISTLASLKNDHVSQGAAIHGDTLFVCDRYGYCYMYRLPEGTRVAQFPLGSYCKEEGAYQNHANQMMFGPEKFDESDPFPLLYVTTGYSNDHDDTGAYIAKCSVERIRCDAYGNWYAQIVQTIQFNDAANIPDADIDGTLKKMYQNGQFLYISGNGYDAAEGYQKIGWGWPHFYVDPAPTSETRDKLYIFSARFRGSEAWEEKNHQKYDFTDYYTDNCFIFTSFDLPPLPHSESDPGYGAVVTLYPRDITGQFTTPFDIYAFQGGTMYRGKIYHSFGDGRQTDKHTNGIRVFDVEKQQAVALLQLHNTHMAAMEPECCCIYNGELALSAYNMNERNKIVDLYVFGYVTDEAAQNCLLCGESLTKS